MIQSALGLPWVVPVVFGCLVAMVAIVANVVASTLKTNAETNLKRRMVEHGYSAEDIERVICATARESDECEECDDRRTVPAKPVKPPKAYKAMG